MHFLLTTNIANIRPILERNVQRILNILSYPPPQEGMKKWVIFMILIKIAKKNVICSMGKGNYPPMRGITLSWPTIFDTLSGKG